MRVRISFDALRLCALVTAGVTSGYLWRAAFESSSPEERLAAKPRIIEPAPAPPVVRIPSSPATPRHQPVTARHLVRSPVAPSTVGRATGALISRPVSPPKPEPVATPPTPPTPAPAPPQPAPAPPTTTTPAQPTPAPATAPTQAAAAPAATPTQPTTSTTSGDGARPGWGNGDKNHDHTGPGKP
jgi:hypothetical protein